LSEENIIVRGARVHNLKNIDVDIPRDSLTVITGLSGSGKSSLAFDTIYAEGQRRYVESLSAYARQFLDMMERPDVDLIEGLSPSISIEQKTISSNPRSTVGTVTEIYDYLRLLFARVGTQFCYQCGRKVQKQSTDQIINSILEYPIGAKLLILAPIVKGRKGHYRELFEGFLKDGFLRVRVDGDIRQIEKGMKVDRYKIHTIEIVIDRIVLKKEMRSRIADSVELALRYGQGVLIIHDGTHDQLFSQKSSCHECGLSYEEPAPNSFSFNTPAGYCPKCEGLGELKAFNMRLVLPDENLSINQEGLAPLGKPRQTWMFSQIQAVANKYGFTFDTPIKKISKDGRDVLLYGSRGEKLEITYKHETGRVQIYKHRYEGLIKMLERWYDDTASNQVRDWIEAFMTTSPCEMCHGGRLRKESLSIRIVNVQSGNGFNIHEVVKLSITQTKKLFEDLILTPRQTEIAHQILKEICQRLDFLLNVGLNYLSLDRSARTLSGGEGQRIRLATQIGTQLVGVLYILDEPSIGLHQRDNIKLIQSLKSLRDLGNTVIVVEHDKEMIESADYIIDLGPRAGEHGGEVVVTGTLEQIIAEKARVSNGKPNRNSLTASYLRGEHKIEIPSVRRNGTDLSLTIEGATGNNLKNIVLKIPLGKLVCVTGVSGSGKSTLINETLFPILSRKIYKTKLVPLPYKSIDGIEQIDKIIDIDQSPIGRTPRSNPATYTGLFTLIRDLFTQLPEAQIRGYKAGRFSFNVKGGRCENCEGDGLRKIEMNFLPDVYVICEICGGKRYNRETLEVHYKGKSIADVLNMTVDDAMVLFSELPRIMRHLRTLQDVGLGYIRLGQQATTLSGGEAQRVKLSTELSKIGTGKTLYILDEPTTGLHFEDIRMLLLVLNRLVDKGNSVVIIEHNLDVIKTADWVIDLGPEGGDEGGEIVAEGTPEKVAKNSRSYTGKYLKNMLQSS
jgi:excinuclease ABC subunit A